MKLDFCLQIAATLLHQLIVDEDALDLGLEFTAGLLILLLWTLTLDFLSVALEMLDFGLKLANLFSTELRLLLVGSEFCDLFVIFFLEIVVSSDDF